MTSPKPAGVYQQPLCHLISSRKSVSQKYDSNFLGSKIFCTGSLQRHRIVAAFQQIRFLISSCPFSVDQSTSKTLALKYPSTG